MYLVTFQHCSRLNHSFDINMASRLSFLGVCSRCVVHNNWMQLLHLQFWLEGLKMDLTRTTSQVWTGQNEAARSEMYSGSRKPVLKIRELERCDLLLSNLLNINERTSFSKLPRHKTVNHRCILHEKVGRLCSCYNDCTKISSTWPRCCLA